MILLSAGHYPEKPGACFDSFCEHDEATRWVGAIARHLPEDKVLSVPSTPLKSKVKFINARNPTMALEVHFNSAVNSKGIHVGTGALCLYYPGSVKGRSYAKDVQSILEPVFGKHWEGVMEGWYRMNKDNGPDFFLAKTKCPSIIIEPEFIHSKNKIVENREEVCKKIADKLKEYL